MENWFLHSEARDRAIYASPSRFVLLGMQASKDVSQCPTLAPFALPKPTAKQYIALQTIPSPMTLSTLNDIFFSATERNSDRAMLSRAIGKMAAHLFLGCSPQRRRDRPRAKAVGNPQRRPRGHPQRESPRVVDRRFRHPAARCRNRTHLLHVDP